MSASPPHPTSQAADQAQPIDNKNPAQLSPKPEKGRKNFNWKSQQILGLVLQAARQVDDVTRNGEVYAKVLALFRQHKVLPATAPNPNMTSFARYYKGVRDSAKEFSQLKSDIRLSESKLKTCTDRSFTDLTTKVAKLTKALNELRCDFIYLKGEFRIDHLVEAEVMALGEAVISLELADAGKRERLSAKKLRKAPSVGASLMDIALNGEEGKPKSDARKAESVAGLDSEGELALEREEESDDAISEITSEVSGPEDEANEKQSKKESSRAPKLRDIANKKTRLDESAASKANDEMCLQMLTQMKTLPESINTMLSGSFSEMTSRLEASNAQTHALLSSMNESLKLLVSALSNQSKST